MRIAGRRTTEGDVLPRGIKNGWLAAFLHTTVMAKINTLEGLLLDQLKDLYSAETQIAEALPKMAEASTSPDLKQGFYIHLEQTREHANRLEALCTAMGEKATGKKCEATAGLVKEGSEAIEGNATPEAKDLMLIAAAERVEHYEIAGYSCALQLARALGLDDAVATLTLTLTEERVTEERLCQSTFPAIGRLKKANNQL